jgi:methionyl-tRNA formyltransferase
VQSARIAYFGLPLGALLLARDGHTIAYAGACRRAPGLRRLATRVAPGRTHLKPDPSSASAMSALRAASPDLVVSWFWTTKLPAPVLAMAPAVGVHPSLLPRHRGPDPYFWTIDAGDAETGVTAHLLDAEYDTGAVLGQERIRMEPTWNAWELARALDRPGLRLLREVVKAFAQGGAPTPVAQDERTATAAPAPTDEDLAIAWSWPAARIERRVRAAAPWPGAWTEIGHRIVTLVRVRPSTAFPRALEPAEATVRTDGIAVVRAGDFAVELHQGRDEDDTPLGAADLAAIVREAQRM